MFAGGEGFTVFDFERPVNAFGVFGLLIPPSNTDPTASNLRFEITFTNNDVVDFDATNTLGLRTPSIAFLGIVDNMRLIDRVIVRGTATPNLDLLHDDLIVGFAVPVPAPALLMLPCFLLIAWRNRQGK